MPAGTILPSKLTAPLPPAFGIFSQRMRELQIGRERLTVLIAPAGFGKTTSALLSLNEQPVLQHWYRLEREDAFLPVFYAQLVETLFSEAAEAASNLRHVLRNVQDFDDDDALLNAEICQLATALWGTSQKKRVLILDDFHRVDSNPHIIRALQYLSLHLPACFSLLLLSRREPPIFADCLLRIGVRLLGEDQLRFNKEELGLFLEKRYGELADPALLSAFFEKTEGWIGGINIICQKMDWSSGSREPSAWLEEIKSSDLSRFFRSMLLELPPQRLEILLKSSVLDDFSREELSVLLELADTEEFIAWLEKSSLYLQKTESSPPRYAFHQLFRSALERLRRERMGESENRALLLRAAEYYRERNLKKGLRFLLQAGEEKRAFGWAEKMGKGLFEQGQPEEMFQLIDVFSPEQIERNPMLLFFSGMMSLNTDKERSRSCFLRAMRGFREMGELSFLYNTLGMMFVLAYQMNDFGLLKEAVQQVPFLRSFLSGRTVRDKLQIGLFIHWIGKDCLRCGAIQRKLLDRRKIREEMWQYSYLMIRGISYYRQGRLTPAAQILRQIISHPIALRNDQWRIIGLVSCCNLPFLRAEEELLSDFAQEFFLLGEAYNSDFARGYGHYMMAHLHYLKGHRGEAIAELQKSVDSYKKYQAEVLIRESELLILLWDETAEALSLIPSCREHLAFFRREETRHGLAELAELVLAILCRRAARYEEAETFMKKALRASRRKGAAQDACGCRLQLADLYYLMGQEKKAERLLRQAVEEIEAADYRYFRSEDAASLQRLAEKARQKKLLPHCFLRFQKHGRESEKGMISNPEGPDRFSVKLFGNFELRGRDFLLREKDFRTRKVSGILKYLLSAAPGQSISREKLALVFWPDTDSKAAFASLRVALYELRKLFAAKGIAMGGEHALIEETKDGFRLCPGLKLESDFQSFIEAYEKRKKKYEKPEERRLLLEKISCLYEGPFMENAAYDDWVIRKQEYFASMISECLHEWAALEAEAGDLLKEEKILQRALELDPYDQKAVDCLCRLYRQNGETERAESLQRHFSARYRKDLDL